MNPDKGKRPVIDRSGRLGGGPSLGLPCVRRLRRGARVSTYAIRSSPNITWP